MPKRITSVYIDDQLWKNARKHAIDKGIHVSDYLEQLLTKDLKK